MNTDVIVYEKKNNLTRIAMLGAGELQEIEFVKENQAAEGVPLRHRHCKAH